MLATAADIAMLLEKILLGAYNGSSLWFRTCQYSQVPIGVDYLCPV
jgi:hypothetical protein